MSIPSQRKFDEKHAENIAKYQRQLRSSYLAAVKSVSNIAVGANLNAKDEFFFRNNPEVNKKVNEVLKQLNSQIYGTSVSGINSEWDLAVEKNNALANYVYGNNLDDLPIEYRDKYFSNNAAARRNFLYRKDGGLKLSDKVWKNTRQFKTELELALEVGIGKGNSAATIARNVTKYLNDPNELYRRVAAKEGGALRLSKAAKAYNPGQGRYRSSYKNALRLTANETNFSYEGSQELKRKEQDFIVGIEIHTSPRHKASDDKGGISCIALQGKYPKDFNWTYKWHVNCRCYSLNILKSRDELDQDLDRILSGKEPNTKSANQVTYVPKSYRNYLNDNSKKWANYKTQPRTFEANKGKFKVAPTKKTPTTPAFNLSNYENQFIDYNEAENARTVSTEYNKVRQEVRKYLESHYDSKEALDSYITDGYVEMREYLSGKVQMASAQLKGNINNLTTFINENKISQSTKLYRRVKGDNAINYFSKLKKGETFTDTSFVSTSLKPAINFGDFEIQIFAKAGQKVANANNIRELEYIIQKGSKFKVLENKGGNLIKVQLL